MGRMPDFEMPPVEPDPPRDAGPAAEPLLGVPEHDAARRALEALAPPASVAGPTAPDADASAADEAEAPRADARRLRSWRRARVPLAAFLAGALLVAGGVVVADLVRSDGERAAVEEAVAAYADVVESADGAALASEQRLDDATATRALLTAGIEPAARASLACDAPRLGVDVATVDCDVLVERRVDPTRLVLERIEGRWLVTDGVEVPVRIRSGALVVEAVDGVPLDPAVARGDQAAWMLPGRYDVDVRTPAQLEVQRLEGLVVSASTGSVRWTSDTTEMLDADVQATALGFLEACATAPREGCPPLQIRPASDRFTVLDVVGRLRPDDPHAMSFDVSIARPVEVPEEFLVVTVRVDFGEDLDRYDVTVP
ncbi:MULTISPECIES: hypothetical protein [unclassified Agrococcus]|uniref:hypothetical protein n=1 Tax=unclassified Agrococcus TaxID=2615065 RepID=UPI00360B4F87